jgi:hypothetical protein
VLLNYYSNTLHSYALDHFLLLFDCSSVLKLGGSFQS